MKAVQQTIKHWEHVLPYAHIPSTQTEYEKMLVFVDELMEWNRHHSHDERATSLLKLIASNIQSYESKQFISKKLSAADMLRFLMEEHGLGQDDFPEIGSQSLLSKILNKERQLTMEHIRHLSKRFSVSPSVFF